MIAAEITFWQGLPVALLVAVVAYWGILALLVWLYKPSDAELEEMDRGHEPVDWSEGEDDD